MAFLNRFYDNGYGAQEHYGEIFFHNGLKAVRYEYDGAESWETLDFRLPDFLKADAQEEPDKERLKDEYCHG